MAKNPHKTITLNFKTTLYKGYQVVCIIFNLYYKYIDIFEANFIFSNTRTPYI